MIDIKHLCKTIAKELNLDYSLVYDIVKFLFEFTKNTMQDQNEDKDILFNNLFRFKLKNKFKS